MPVKPELAAMVPAWQAAGVPKTTDTARRWAGYVCPDCRFVFRVPRDHDGTGIVCPGCRRLMRLPGPDDIPPPLLAPARTTADLTEDAEHGQLVRKRRRRRRKPATDDSSPSWESGVKSGSGRRGGGHSLWLLVAGGVLFAVVIGFMIHALNPGEAAPEPPPASQAPPDDETPVVVKRSEADLLKEAEALAADFLSADTVEKLLPLIRNPEVTGPRIRKQHPDGTLKPPGLVDFNVNRMVEYTGPYATVEVNTRDYVTRSLSFVETGDGLKIDWESWTGWSEMPWDLFLESKPPESKIFRVRIKKADYYNFAFSDDRKWQSYRIESADGEHMIFGYTERGSLTDEKIRGSPNLDNPPVMLALKFPMEEDTRNQVIIERHLHDGWLDPETPGP
jgi:hypothetical protein